MEKEKDEKVLLPDEVTMPTPNMAPRDLVIVSIPKCGKGTILGDFTTKNNDYKLGNGFARYN